MARMRCGLVAALCGSLWGGCGTQREADRLPAREIEFAVRAESATAELGEAVNLRGLGWIKPLHKDPPAHAIFGRLPVHPYEWSENGFQFVPRSSGWATLAFCAPRNTPDNGALFEGDVAIAAIAASGAEIVNGDLRRRWRKLVGWTWQGPPGRLQADLIDQAHIVLPLGARMEQRIYLKAGETVTIRFQARSLLSDSARGAPERPTFGTAAHEAMRHYRRGVSLGNYLEAPPAEDWGARYDAGDFDAIRAEGFDHVRIPVAWHHYMGAEPRAPIDEALFRRVDDMVRMAVERDLAVILNWHHFDAFTDDPAAQEDRFDRGWAQIAAHYAVFPGRIAFELLNEPRGRADTLTMNGVYRRTIAALRRTVPDAILFVGPGDYNRAEELPLLQLPPDDDRLVVAVHVYDPHFFTHQGASWVGYLTATAGVRFPGPPSEPILADTDALKDAEWMAARYAAYNRLPTAWNPCGRERLARNLRLARAWGAYHGRPVHIGEWGCIALADATSRAEYYRAMRGLLDEYDLPWAIWSWKAGFRYWDEERQAPMPGLREAVFPERRL
jgi:endoglucanase